MLCKIQQVSRSVQTNQRQEHNVLHKISMSTFWPKVTYCYSICTMQPNKSDVHRVRMSVGGDSIDTYQVVRSRAFSRSWIEIVFVIVDVIFVAKISIRPRVMTQCKALIIDIYMDTPLASNKLLASTSNWSPGYSLAWTFYFGTASLKIF